VTLIRRVSRGPGVNDLVGELEIGVDRGISVGSCLHRRDTYKSSAYGGALDRVVAGGSRPGVS
jgi:hypothetical protein